MRIIGTVDEMQQRAGFLRTKSEDMKFLPAVDLRDLTPIQS
jgi:hypothetical protein